MKKILVSTWCTDDYSELLGVEKLANSIKYFHPEVDHVIFDTKMTEQIHSEMPWMKPIWMMAATCLPFVEEYDMVVHLDADAVVTGPMTEFFESEEDIIGVRNNNSLDKASGHDFGITITHLPPFGNGQQIPIQGFINAGMIGANNKEFWVDWHDVNKQSAKIKTEVNPYAHGIGDEQDTLNQIFHSGEYTTKIVDARGTGVSYGLSNTWGTVTHWDSWKDLYVEDDCLCLDDPADGAKMKVKVLHQAGGSAAAQLNKSSGGLREWMKTVMSTEAINYINKITS